ncbi:hypothetical protein RN001_005180 [Aquatica leii]|uniref:ferroxidase n=1 Tax=Aquatica leii TaxID=1421715 RepID=A0AAN7PFQ3_9COLE|nr:hypothetical protein RN001_005180 [Aquatica leii]
MVTSVLNQFPNTIKVQHKFLSTIPNETEVVDFVTYEKVCEETLESLADYFEEIVENAHHLNSADVTYSSGVLTINFGKPYGTYVINRQTPNRQIWLSSPTSGPKRYDYNIEQNSWIYKHNGKSLHQLLQDEVPLIVKNELDFSCCSHSLV